MPAISKIKNLEHFRDAVFAFRLPRIILTALDLQLFTVIGQKIWPIKKVGQKPYMSVNEDLKFYAEIWRVLDYFRNKERTIKMLVLVESF